MSARAAEGPLRGDTVTLSQGWRGDVEYRARGWLIPLDPDDGGPALWLRRLDVPENQAYDDDDLFLEEPEAALYWDSSSACWRSHGEFDP